ncbi:MAG: hypothetical protein GF355_01875, partial [Candidatus Eisenbacteria bacterium]|nr:hypothetical protein [Candidatus Eisenbacteria bacterium]
MRRLMFLATIMLSITPAIAYEYWNNVRHSALLPDDHMSFRVENPSGAGVENALLYENDGIAEEPMTPIQDGPATVTATVPGPVAQAAFYGFRLLQGDELDLMPVRIADGVDPDPANVTRLRTDPAGDELFGYTNLDLTDCRFSFSSTRLFGLLQNAGGGFPVVEGLTFFGYLVGIADPALADPDTVFALLYTYEQSGIISPGLYKITGPGLDDLEKIGEVIVEEFPSENSLIISCHFADLLADSYFASWYDPNDPIMGVAGFTQRITFLGGAEEADRSEGGRCYLREVLVEPAPNRLPELRDLIFQGHGAEAHARVEYEDDNGHCPVLSEIVFDGTTSVAMYPQSLDYSLPVVYRTEAGVEPLASGDWETAEARFSDNLTDVVTLQAETSAAGDGMIRMTDVPRIRVSPNPAAAPTRLIFDLHAEDWVRLSVIDVVGREVAEVTHGRFSAGTHAILWSPRDGQGRPLPAGTYFCRLRSSQGAFVFSLRLLR